MSRASRLSILVVMSTLLSNAASNAMLPTAAFAREDEEDAAQGIVVRFGAADSRTMAGARRLLDRIGDAALEACGASPFSLIDVRRVVMASDCWHDAMEHAVRRIHAPALDAAFLHMPYGRRTYAR